MKKQIENKEQEISRKEALKKMVTTVSMRH
jgi:hypothetical protein